MLRYFIRSVIRFKGYRIAAQELRKHKVPFDSAYELIFNRPPTREL